VVVRKHISKETGAACLPGLEEIRYFFYITNEWVKEPHEVVLGAQGANGRCHQENLIQQLHHGVYALTAPVDNLESNWAYMVMTALAWNLKAWAALVLPETGRWQEKYRAEKLWLLGLEFKTFVNGRRGHVPGGAARRDPRGRTGQPFPGRGGAPRAALRERPARVRA